MLPRCRTTPPRICTSKCRMFLVRRAASRQAANASGSRSSSVAPLASRSFSAGVMALSCSSVSGLHLLFERVDLGQQRAGSDRRGCLRVAAADVAQLAEQPGRCWSRRGGSMNSAMPSDSDDNPSVELFQKARIYRGLRRHSGQSLRIIPANGARTSSEYLPACHPKDERAGGVNTDPLGAHGLPTL